MSTTLSILFYGKKSRITKDNLLPIYLRVTINGERVELSTQRYVHQDKWSIEMGRVKGNSEEARSINSYLDILKAKVYDHQRDIIHAGDTVTADTMRGKLLGHDEKKRMLIPIFENHNKEMKALIGREYAKGTWDRFETTLDHIKNFLTFKYNIQDIDIRKVDHSFISDFDFYLRTPHKVYRDGKFIMTQCANNSTVKYMKNFKKIILLCISRGWLDKNPFTNYKGRVRVVEKPYLTDAELKTLQNKTFTIERLNLVKDIFLFSCYTGLAYIDARNLVPSDIVIGIDGEKWIYTQRQKTEIPCRIPLLQLPLSIIEKYKNHPQTSFKVRLLPVLSNQKMNGYLKEIAALTGIQKEISFHTARHTFATTVTLANGVPMESLAEMMGLTNLRQVQHYGKIVDRKVSNDMKLLRSKLENNSSIIDTGKSQAL